MPPTHLLEAIVAFLAHARHDRGYAPRTIASYTADLASGADFFAQYGIPRTSPR